MATHAKRSDFTVGKAINGSTRVTVTVHVDVPVDHIRSVAAHDRTPFGQTEDREHAAAIDIAAEQLGITLRD